MELKTRQDGQLLIKGKKFTFIFEPEQRNQYTGKRIRGEGMKIIRNEDSLPQLDWLCSEDEKQLVLLSTSQKFTAIIGDVPKWIDSFCELMLAQKLAE